MSFKKIIARAFANVIVKRTQKWVNNPVKTQQKVFENLIAQAMSTAFGKDHDFAGIHNYEDFKARVPITDYEGLRQYIDRMVAGEPDILWPGKPLYLAKTSGTTSGAKYIPLTRESMPYHIKAARNALLHYIYHSKNTDFILGKMIFLQGSPALTQKNGLNVGRLSGIVAHFVPGYLQKNRLPTLETNSIEDWDKKVDAIIKETLPEKMTLISGIAPWVQNYFERLIKASGKKTVSEIFPNFSLFVTGGVAYEPYKKRFEELIGKEIDKVETYPSSEGFIAYQDRIDCDDLLLLLDGGIFFEFVPADKFYEENPPRLSIAEVETGINYVIILNTNAGLWGYNIGDTIEFTSTEPYRIKVTGRIKHYISAFGEHVIGSEVEHALLSASKKLGLRALEFTVAPQVNPKQGLPYHEWFIEFDGDVDKATIEKFALEIDEALRKKNNYYDDLRKGDMLKVAEVKPLKKNAFNTYMKSIGKFGGQNKLPRLSNDRKIADTLRKFSIK